MKKQAKEIAKLIKKHNKIILFHHKKPDGDSISCSYGLMKAIQKKYPNKEVKWHADKEYIKEYQSNIVKDFKDNVNDINDEWLAIIGDAAINERIYGLELFEKAGTKISFDHHQNDPNMKFDYYWQEKTLGASSVQAYHIAKALKFKFNEEIAISLLIGILTDTFNFMYSLADRRPIDAAKDLLQYISNDRIDSFYQYIKRRKQEDVKFHSFVLSNYKSEKNVAFLYMKDSDLKKMKLNINDVSKVNLLANIENIYVWMFIIEDKENKCIKISLRSLGVDVNKIANKFDGGGHVRASGIKLDLDWTLPPKVIKEAQKEIAKYKKEQ